MPDRLTHERYPLISQELVRLYARDQIGAASQRITDPPKDESLGLTFSSRRLSLPEGIEIIEGEVCLRGVNSGKLRRYSARRHDFNSQRAT
jgi:hypothetical protein